MRPERRIRIVHVVPDLGFGGAERHVTTLMPALDPAGFEASVICVGDEGALFDDLAKTSVSAVALGRTKRQAVQAILGLVREFRRFRPDVVLTRGYNAEMLGRIAARLCGVPVSVVWVHNCGDAEPRGRFRRAADRLLERHTAAYFGVAESQVPYMTGELGYPESKITVIHNGVDPAGFAPEDNRHALLGLPIGDGQPVVGIVARMSPEKDHALLLRAVPKVLAEVPDAKFLMIGDGPLRNKLEQQATDLGIADAVVFTGARDDIADLLRALDVFTLCSYTIECFPMSLLEAMAAGRPAVCTDVGGVGEMLADGLTGHLVPPRDPEALADRLVALLTDEPIRERMGAAARRRVEDEFSLAAGIARAEQAIRSLVPKQPVSPGPPGSPVTLTVVLDTVSVGGMEKLLLDMFTGFDPAVVCPRIVCLREPGAFAHAFQSAGFEVSILDSERPRRRSDPRRASDLVRDLRASGTDVVLVSHHQRAALLLARVAARVARIPNIVAAHDMDLTSVGGRVLPRWAVATLWLTDALVLLSPSQGDYLHREEGVGHGIPSSTREVLIPNGIHVGPEPRPADRTAARRRLKLDDDLFVVGIVARLSPQKAHQVLFAAIAELHAHVPRLRLVVVGGGPRKTELQKLAAELGITEVTEFTGEHSDVRSLLPAFDVACLSSNHEGVPIVALEAMAAGLPMVVTDCGALRDLITDGVNGYLVPVGDSAAMADRLLRLASDSALARDMGGRGRTKAERNYRIADTIHGYEQLLTDVTARRTHR